MRWVLCAVGVVMSGVAMAAPTVLTHQGRALDAQGIPLEGAAELVVSLYDEEDSASPFWTKTYANTPVDSGYFAVRLVADNSGLSISAADLADGETWVETSIAGQAVGGRQPLDSVPYAVIAGGVQLPAAVAGTCDTPGLLGYDSATGDMLLCHGGTFQAVATAQDSGGGPSGSAVGVRNAGMPAEWALLQLDESTTVSNIADWRAVCSAAGLGVPASSESNANCAENLGSPRHVVTTRCNMYSDSENTWALNQGVFQESFAGGQLYFLSYSTVGAQSVDLRWYRLSCSSAPSGALSHSTCPAATGQTNGSFTASPGDWITCARPI